MKTVKTVKTLGVLLAILTQACGGKPTEVKPQEVPFWHSAKYRGIEQNERGPLAETEVVSYRTVDFYVTLSQNCTLEENIRIIWCSHLEKGDTAPIWHSYDPYKGYDCKTLSVLEKNRAYGLQWVKRVDNDPYQIQFRLVGAAFKDRTITVYSSKSTDGPFTLTGEPANDLLEKAGLQKKTDRCDVDAKTTLNTAQGTVEARLEKIIYVKHTGGVIPQIPYIHILGYNLETGERVQERIDAD